MIRMRPSLMWVVVALVGLGLAPGVAVVQSQDKGVVVIASYGGSFQDALREAMLKPFERATGIKVIEAVGPSLAKIRAMVQTGNPEWDVADMTPSDFLVAVNNNLVEKLDYTSYLKDVLRDVDPRVITPYGLGNYFYSTVIGYNTKAYSKDNHPRSWAEVWDAAKFPGPRVIPAGDWVVPPLEYALLADGVPPDKLYPLDMPRAYRSLARIKPHVVKWTKSSAAPPQALVDGEAVVAAVTLGRIAKLKEDGAPVDFEWNQALLQLDYWVILKGAKNYQNAMKYIEFATRPEIQAALFKIQTLGPVNRRAFEHLPPERARQLPSHPDNLKRAVLINPEWWAQRDASGKSNVEKNVEMWNEFASK